MKILTDFICHHYSDNDLNIWYLMKKDGNAFFKITEYKENKTYLVLSDLSVDFLIRKKGIANSILEYSVLCCKEREMDYLYLWTENESWMYHWYQRKGFEIYKYYEDIKGSVWMRKKINP